MARSCDILIVLFVDIYKKRNSNTITKLRNDQTNLAPQDF